MRRLYADVGNSRTKLAESTEGTLRVVDIRPTAAGLVLPVDCSELVVVSVVATATQKVRAAAEAAGIRIRQLGAELLCPLKLDYATPETLGQDRVAAAYAAWIVHQQGALVLAAGTALTLDWVDGTGTFRGGLIAPGWKAMRMGLAGAADALPEADATAPFPARSSAACVGLGLDAAFTGLVLEAVRRARAVVGEHLPLVICGGGCAQVAQVLQGGVVEEHLVLRGLALCDAAR